MLDDIEERQFPVTKAAIDAEVSEFSYDRRLAIAARRAADLFDYCAMYATPHCCAS